MDQGPTIPGPYISDQATENSPLRRGFFDSTKRSFENWLWGWDFTVDSAGSLKTIVVVLFLFTGGVTLALLGQVYYGDTTPRHGAVSTDNTDCSYIAYTVLQKGGNAVDAVIAASMCIGVVNFHLTGLGGGGIFLGYNQKKGDVFDVINFTPTLPGNAKNSVPPPDVPGLTVGVPGFLAGLWTAHQRHGSLPWTDLIAPSARLAREGFTVSEQLANAATCLRREKYTIGLAKVLDSLVIGQNISLPYLADTLDLIAQAGPSVFYNGSIADEIVYSVKLGGGSMMLSDLAAYSPSLGLWMKTKFEGYNIFVPASTFGGNFLLRALEFLQQKELRPEDHMTNETVRDLSDALYDTYLSLVNGMDIATELPMPAAAVVSAMDIDDNYVCVVSGLNTWLGSQIFTEREFILNSALANGGFDNEGRPMSLATPVMAAAEGNVCGRRLISGAADARTLIQVLTELIVFDKGNNVSVEAPRFEITNTPRSIALEVKHEPGFSESVISSLRAMPMNISASQSCPSINPASYEPYSSINVITKFKDSMWPYSDSRGGGDAMQF